MPRGEHLKGARPLGSGRKKGEPNKATAEARAVMAEIHALAADRVQEILADPEAKHSDIVRIWEVTGKKLVPDLSSVTLNPDADGQAAPLVIHIHPPSHDSAGNSLS
jgi:hypothetical protein